MPSPRPSVFQQVLCPVDFSPYSRSALRYAASIAARSEGRLTVLFVNDPLLSAAAAASAYDVKALARDTGAELRRFVSRAIGRHSSGVSFVVANGHPGPEIERTAEQLGADLVVVGSRGLTGTSKWFFGSTTERLLRTARVPILVAPRARRQSADWEKTLSKWPGRQALVPIDLEDFHAPDVRRAVETATALGAKATLLYVVPPPQVPDWLRLPPRRRDAGRVDEAEQRVDAVAKSVGADSYDVAFGTAAEEITTAAAASGVQLVILTMVRAAGIFGPRQGSITYRVVSSEVAPVLALPSLGPRRRTSS